MGKTHFHWDKLRTVVAFDTPIQNSGDIDFKFSSVVVRKFRRGKSAFREETALDDFIFKCLRKAPSDYKDPRWALRASYPRHAPQIRARRFPFEKAGRGGRSIGILYVKYGRAQVQATFSSFAARRANFAVGPLLPILSSPPHSSCLKTSKQA